METTADSKGDSKLKHIVVIGGGFGGIELVKKLKRKLIGLP